MGRVGTTTSFEIEAVATGAFLPEVLFSGVSTERLCLVPTFELAFSCLAFGFLLAAICSLSGNGTYRQGKEST